MQRAMPGHDEHFRLGQFALAAQAQIFLGFEFRHPQQMAQQFQIVGLRQPHQVGSRLRDEGCGFIRVTFAERILVRRTAPRARGRVPATLTFLGQNAATPCIDSDYAL
jgi:hypothetical protein